MEVRTHLAIDRELCGEPIELSEGFCRVRLVPTEAMAADGQGLVHGGFLFGLADYAAMLAVNQPTVVLASAEARFLKPVLVGDEVIAEAAIVDQEGPRTYVQVEVRRGEQTVMSGEFHCYTPRRHVLEPAPGPGDE